MLCISSRGGRAQMPGQTADPRLDPIINGADRQRLPPRHVTRATHARGHRAAVLGQPHSDSILFGRDFHSKLRVRLVGRTHLPL